MFLDIEVTRQRWRKHIPNSAVSVVFHVGYHPDLILNPLLGLRFLKPLSSSKEISAFFFFFFALEG